MIVRRSLWVLAAGLLATGVAAERTIERRGPARSHGAVEIFCSGGSVAIEGWDREEVFVLGRVGSRVEDLRLEIDGRQVRVGLEIESSDRLVPGPAAAAELSIRLPAASEVVVRTADAAISVRGVTGSVSAISASGAITVEGNLLGVETTSASGATSIDIDALRLYAVSASGAIELRGRIEALRARTASGDLRVAAPVVRDAWLESVTGAVTFDGSLSEIGHLRIAVHSGPARLVLPADVAARFRLETMNGTIASAFGPEMEAGIRALELVTGDGAARVEVETLDGAIKIERRPAPPR